MKNDLDHYVQLSLRQAETPNITMHSEDTIRVVPLSDNLRKSSRLGAEVLLPGASTSFDLKSLSGEEKATLRQAFYDQGILLIRNQHDLNPDALYDVAELIDPHPTHFHSGGKRQVTDPKNILALNGCNRLPRAPQVTVIGKGKFEEYEGIPELDLKHLVRFFDLNVYCLLTVSRRTIYHSTRTPCQNPRLRKGSQGLTGGTWMRHCTKICLAL